MDTRLTANGVLEGFVIKLTLTSRSWMSGNKEPSHKEKIFINIWLLPKGSPKNVTPEAFLAGQSWPFFP